MIIVIILIAALIIVLLAKSYLQKLHDKYHGVEEQEVEVKDVLDEKDSIKQAEEIVRKRKRLSRTVKLSLASIIVIAILIVVGVFVFDTYKPSSASFHNETSKEYWATLPGFDSYEDLYNKYVSQQNYMDEDYNSPFTDPSASVYKKIKQARYTDELDAFIAPYKSEKDSTTDPERKAELELIIQEANEFKKTLPSWTDYRDKVLLGYHLFATEGDYEFWMNISTTGFKVVDKSNPANIVEWYSNPDNASSNSQKDVLKLWGSRTGSNVKSYGTYDYSTSSKYKEDDVTPNFAIKNFTEERDGKETSIVQVWYKLEERGINWTYFPKYLSVATVEQLKANNEKLVAEGAEYVVGNEVKPVILWSEKLNPNKDALSIYDTLFGSKGGLYKKVSATSPLNRFGEEYYEYNGDLSDLKGLSIDKMYTLYTHFGFSQDMLVAEDNHFEQLAAENNVTVDLTSKMITSKDSYTVAIQYELTEDGLTVTIPGNSITAVGKNEVVYIDLLEYFTAAPNTEEGYTIIPDGSGSVLEHNNGKTSCILYNKRLYTTDLSMSEEVMKAETYDIMLPMYAVVNQTSLTGVIADVTDGAAQMELYADISGRGSEIYNKHYFRIHYRESQTIKVSSVSQPIDKYNHSFMGNDISVDFRFLGKDVVADGYSGVAREYRELLIERYDMHNKYDETEDIVIDIDVIGGYDFKNNIFGIVYKDKDTLTTFEQLKKMIEDIEGTDFEYINVFYKGWRKEGLVDSSFKKIKTYDALGNLNELKEINDIDGVTVYPYVNFGVVNKYQESFGSNHYNTRNVIGEIISVYPYNLQSNIWDKKAQKINIISPRYYQAFAQSLADNFAQLFRVNKDNEVLANISLDSIGSVLTGDYQKNQEMFKINAVYEQINALDIIKNAGIESINLYRPYDYAFPYVTNAKEIPYDSTQYQILDYSIPFYQLVVSGLFDYSGESINANSEDGTQRHILRILETGSNASFTFTYDGSEVLLTTDYNQYYYTEYSKWLEDVEAVYNAYHEAGIAGLRLVQHEYIEQNVSHVTYRSDDGKVEVQLLINNAPTSYYDPVTGISVQAYDFKVLGGK